jgi:hypothetical protein
MGIGEFTGLVLIKPGRMQLKGAKRQCGMANYEIEISRLRYVVR